MRAQDSQSVAETRTMNTLKSLASFRAPNWLMVSLSPKPPSAAPSTRDEWSYTIPIPASPNSLELGGKNRIVSKTPRIRSVTFRRRSSNPNGDRVGRSCWTTSSIKGLDKHGYRHNAESFTWAGVSRTSFGTRMTRRADLGTFHILWHQYRNRAHVGTIKFLQYLQIHK